MPLTVGALAQAAGLTVRTLHHWDELGLLRPADRAASGRRLYSPADVERLYRIVALRRLGLSLEDIRGALESEDLRSSVAAHLARVEAEIAQARAVQQRLRGILDAFDRLGEPSTDQIIDVIEVMTMLEARSDAIGETRMEQVRQDWAQLISELDAERTSGTDPAHPRVQALAARWRSLMYAFTGGDEDVHRSVNRAYAAEPERGGMIPEVLEYVGRAFEVAP
jgi:DNA-binding transcriptional MerR regulator